MTHRKTIAIIVGTYLGFFRNDSLEGIIKQSKELGYDVIIISAFTVTDDRTLHQLGEENLYRLLKSPCIDGFIIVGYTLWAEVTRKRVLDILSEIENANVVLLDDADNYGYEGVICDDRQCFEQMTDHLIDFHGYKKLYCLTGIKEFEVSTMRLNGFFDSLKKHNMEITDDCWSFGDFWTQAATELAEKIANNGIERPEAVICGNDMSAVTLVNQLMSRGVKVPDDVAVVGFDFGEESVYNSPTVTTCIRPTLYTGEKCVCVLHERLTGEKAETVDDCVIRFIDGESCGCRKDMEFSRKFYERKNNIEDDESLYRMSCMQESLMACDSYDELINNITTKMYLLRGIESYALCLNNGWNSFREDDNEYLREGYERNMFEALVWIKDSDIYKNLPFDSTCIIPDNMLDEGPTVCFVNAIHFEDRCFGYEVSRFSSEDISPGEVYHSWSTSISVSLEYIRVQERMKLMYDRAFASSIRDAMTGLYNRKGYELYIPTIYKTAKEKKLPLLTAVADLDGLKFINDTYGHVEGDNAISVLAKAIQTCCGNGEYCIRSGGDEFVIIGCYDYTEAITDYYRQRIEGYLQRYNESSGKPYAVEVSVGFSLGLVEDESDIEAFVKLADANMYADKTARKQAKKSK